MSLTANPEVDELTKSIQKVGDILNKEIENALKTSVSAINSCVGNSGTIAEILDCIDGIEDKDLKEFTKQLFMTQYAPRLGFIGIDWDTLKSISHNPYTLLNYLYRMYMASMQQAPMPQITPQPQSQPQQQQKALERKQE